MSAGEILGRARERLRCRGERKSYLRSARRAKDRTDTAPAATPVDRQAVQESIACFIPGTRVDELRELEREFPQQHSRLAAQSKAVAERVLSGSWELLGHRYDLRSSIDWQRDPRSEFRWPKGFYADLPLYELDDGVDVKYVWELGRQQYLVDLARGWRFCGDEKYACRAREILLDWIEHNPLYEGIHWTSGLEVAMRAISWLWTLATLSEWDGWQPGEFSAIISSLENHATYLEHHFSFYSSPYNHLIGEAAALLLIGLAFGETDDAERWRTRGRDVLVEHGSKQFYGDGFSVEQATGYHFFTLGFLTMAVAASRRSNAPIGDLEAVVHRAYRAAAVMQQPGGIWPAIGDVDSARSIPVPCDEFWDFRSLCALGAVLFDDPVLKAETTEPGDELFWLLGNDGLQKWKELPHVEAPKSAVLPDSGYAVARRGDDWLLFDAGPIAAGLHPDATPSAAHGHADTLQVLFNLGGKPVLCDSGMPFYAGPREWVDHFRGPAAHNTIEIEGAPMARCAGRLAWSHAAPRPALQADFSDDIWLACGRAEWAAGVVVERHVLALPGYGLWIADWIKTDRPRRVRWHWQLPADSLLQSKSDTSAQFHVGRDDLQLATWSDSQLSNICLNSAEEGSPRGWQAPGYGTREAGQHVVYELQTETDSLTVTFIGRSLIPFHLSLRGNEVAGGESDLIMAAAVANESRSSGVRWKVMTETGVATVVASEADAQASSWNVSLLGNNGSKNAIDLTEFRLRHKQPDTTAVMEHE